LGGLLPITTQPPPTTTPQSVKPPFEASNLINTKPIPVEGPSVRKTLDLNPFKKSAEGKCLPFQPITSESKLRKIIWTEAIKMYDDKEF
jgi:hypothetical protein